MGDTDGIQKDPYEGFLIVNVQTVIDGIWIYVCGICFKEFVAIVGVCEARRADMTLQCLL